jgi:hypothetical protein
MKETLAYSSALRCLVVIRVVVTDLFFFFFFFFFWKGVELNPHYGDFQVIQGATVNNIV